MRARIRSWSKCHVNRPKPDVTEVVPPPPIMPADFPYVWGSGLHLWQAPRTARSTRRFGARLRSWRKVPCEPTKTGGRRSGSAAPRPCRLTFHTTGGAAFTFVRPPGPPNRPVVLGVRGSHAPPAPKPAVAEVVLRAPNNARWLFTRCGKQAAA